MATHGPLRGVRYDYPAQCAVDDACERWARADDAVRLLEWIIVRDPTEGCAITESGVTRTLTLPGAGTINVPTVTFVYEMSDRYITVRVARFEDAKPEGRA